MLSVLEEAAKLAPIVTWITAVVAASIAIIAVRTQRDLARKKSSLDLIMKMCLDKHFGDIRLHATDFIINYDGTRSRNALEASEKERSFVALLETMDFIAVGIKNKALDEQVCYDCLCIMVVGTWRVAQKYVPEGKYRELREFRELAERWSYRLKHNDRRPPRKALFSN